MSRIVNRRKFLRGALMTGTVAAGFVSLEERILMDAMARGATHPAPMNLPGPIPTGKLGNLTISRIVSGGNLMGGWAHSRDLLYVSELMKAYNTEERQFATFALLEQGGVNTVQVDMTQIAQVMKYNKEHGGKLQVIANVRPLWGLWDRPALDEMKKNIDLTVDQGVVAAYVHGGYGDKLMQAALEKGRKENIEFIGQMVEYIRKKGLPAGIGSHALEVPMECSKAGIEPDFYFKTFHHDRYWSAHPKEFRRPFTVDNERSTDHNATHDNIFDLDPQATAAYMKTKKQPWFAFKTLAAGAIPPAEGFKYAFENGADFIVVGMLDFQVAANLKLITEVLASVTSRSRAWCA